MKPMRVAQDIVPIGAFKSRAAHWLKRVAQTGEPLVITYNGRPAGVVLAPADFDRAQEERRFLESIAAGVADAEAGRVMDTATLGRRLARSGKTR